MNYYFFLFSYFYITPTASYGNCLSFNYAANTELDPLAGERYSSKTGPFFGLSMVLNLEQRYYIGGGITQELLNKWTLQLDLGITLGD